MGDLIDKLKGSSSKSDSKSPLATSGKSSEDTGPNKLGSPPAEDASGSKSSAPSVEPTHYYTILTKDGTTVEQFEQFIESLDGGRGFKRVYTPLMWQLYRTKLTDSEFAEAKSRNSPIIEFFDEDDVVMENRDEENSVIRRDQEEQLGPKLSADITPKISASTTAELASISSEDTSPKELGNPPSNNTSGSKSSGRLLEPTHQYSILTRVGTTPAQF